jgi:histidinol-phosphate aminotransferase
VPSVGNFLLVDFGSAEKAGKAFDYLMDNGIIVRPVANYGLHKYLRITVGLEDENEAVMQTLSRFMG